MEHRKPRGKPEAKGANRLCNYMRARGWGIWKIGGSKYTVGWPDYYAYHPQHGHRWIETKTKTGKLEPSQKIRFRELTDKGDKVYVLTDEKHYDRLFKEPNWIMYVRGIGI